MPKSSLTFLIEELDRAEERVKEDAARYRGALRQVRAALAAVRANNSARISLTPRQIPGRIEITEKGRAALREASSE